MTGGEPCCVSLITSEWRVRRSRHPGRTDRPAAGGTGTPWAGEVAGIQVMSRSCAVEKPSVSVDQ